MLFRNEKHKQYYEKHLARCRNKDCYEKALVYTLGITDCKIDDLYDFDTCLVKPEGVSMGWVTGSDYRIIKLAFHLYTDRCPLAKEFIDEGNYEAALKETNGFLICELFRFRDSLFEYMLEAIRIRFEFSE